MKIKIPSPNILSGFFRSVTLLPPLETTLDDALGHLASSDNSFSTQNFEIDCFKLDKGLSSFDYIKIVVAVKSGTNSLQILLWG